jgi:alpha-beta hydrolase superfamily lysophospholipase
LSARASVALGISLLCLVSTPPASPTPVISIRGHEQALHISGSPDGYPVVISSGDGGWVHLAPHAAEVLADHGFFVVGFDVRAYLSSFTQGRTTLDARDEPADYRVLSGLAMRATGKPPILIGVSAGAGLSVLAAGDSQTSQLIAGVLALGLPDTTELGWRWRDAVIYVTHAAPNEPVFGVSSVVDRVAPLPFAVIQSTGDEFVPMADVQRLMSRAREPKQLWIVKASNHRFSDNPAEFDARLIEAVQWILEHQQHG